MDEQRDFTIDPVNYKGLPEYVDKLKTYGMHYIIILVSIYSNDININDFNLSKLRVYSLILTSSFFVVNK